MKRLIVTLLSSIVVLITVGQNNPMVVVGDMKIAANGTMRSEGTVNMKTTTVKKSVIVNEGTIDIAGGGIIFYSDTDKDGMLMTKSGGKVTAPTDASKVKVHKVFERNNFWYAISFPFDVNVNAVKNVTTGATNRFGTDFWVYEYDSERRANTGLMDDKNWKAMTGTVIKRGKGYRILSLARELEFPAAAYPTTTVKADSLFAYSNKDLDNLVDYKHKDQNLVQYYPEGRGWNYIGGLNTCAFDLEFPTNFTITIDGVTNGGWNKTIYYMRRGSEAFDQKLLTVDDAIASPFVPFFVQTKGKDVGSSKIVAKFLNKGISVENARPADFRSSEAATTEDIIWSLNLRAGEPADHIYLVFGDNYKDDYLIEEDALKMFSKGELQLWTEVSSSPLFVNALPKKGGKEVKIGVSVPEAGQYTFEFTRKIDDGHFIQSALLLDKIDGTKTDVLAQTYSFAAKAPFDTSDRFILYVNNIPTGLDALDSPSVYAYAQEGLLTVKNVASGDKIQVVDLSGRIVASGVAQSNEFSTPLNQTGVFIVNVKGERNAVLKVLSK
jgi:hypothetical protein